jgi:ubiquinone/menaquinone biosynthesis C-methylase UbiE
VRSFWRNYLVGRDGSVGIELMTQIRPYRELLRLQISELDLRPGQRIADLGSGTGALPLSLIDMDCVPGDVSVVEFDYVREGLCRCRHRLDAEQPQGHALEVSFVEANLDAGNGIASFPVATGSFDGAVASLMLSYVSRPIVALREMHRILRPGARLVVSSLRQDADMSKLFIDGLAELRTRGATLVPDDHLDRAARNYMNQASRLLDLEESGVFRFWNSSELASLISRAGFEVIATQESFGSPPQAVVITAIRR